MQIRTLRAKLLLYFIPVTVTVLLLSAFIIGSSAQNTVFDAVRTQTSETVIAMEKLVEEWIIGLRRQLSDIANSTMIQSMDEQKYLPRLQEVVSESDGLFENIFVSTPAGEYRSADGITMNISGSSYFQDIFRAGKDFSITDAVLAEGAKKPVILLAFPIKNDLNSVIGMLVGRVHIEVLNQKIGFLKFGESGYAMITDGTGLIIAHSMKPEYIMTLNTIRSAQLGFEGLDEAGRRMLNGESGIAEYNRPGGEFFYLFFQNIPDTPGWALGVGLPRKEISSHSIGLLWIVVISFGITLIIIGFIAFFSGSMISVPIREVGKELKRFSDLDLTRKASKADRYLGRTDEIGQLTTSLSIMVGAFRSSLKSLYIVVEELKAASTDIASNSQQQKSSSSQLANTAQNVEQNAQNASASIEEVTSGIEEVATSAQEVAKIAQELSGEMQSTSQTVEDGVIAIHEALRSIEEAQKQTKDASTASNEVAIQAIKVGEIVDAISSISEQTNLLALNAAIEAARAGEAGRGFAVVSDEIRKLAEESKKATTHIASILKKLTEGIRKVDLTSSKTVELVQKVNEGGNKIDQQFKKISSSVEKVNALIGNLTASSQQQGAAAEEMATAMDHSSKAVSEISDQIQEMAKKVDLQAKGAQQVSLSAAALDQLAQKAEEEMKKFQLSKE